MRQQKETHIVFLYSEMAGYFLACLRALSAKVDRITVFHWPVNPEAPFDFVMPDSAVRFIDRTTLDEGALLAAVSDCEPSAIVCSGWMDKGYLSVLKHLDKRVPSLCIIDTHWRGDLKQRLLCMLAPWRLRDRFTHAWVAGDPQRRYAEQLGFKSPEILDGYYSADVPLFEQVYRARQPILQDLPRVFIYVGRYIRHKGIYTMWSAFSKARAQSGHDWELWCVGTGEEYEQRVEAEGIRHFGFLQPEEMSELMTKAGVFVLPSLFEPWGVVVHEYATAGFPMILSDRVGAATRFLRQGENGLLYDPTDENALVKAFVKMMDSAPEHLSDMAERSHELGTGLDPVQWSDKLISLS